MGQESEQEGGTHFLDSAGGDKLRQGKEPQQEGHPLSEEHRGRINLGQGKNLSEQGALTNWRAQREE